MVSTTLRTAADSMVVVASKVRRIGLGVRWTVVFAVVLAAACSGRRAVLAQDVNLLVNATQTVSPASTGWVVISATNMGNAPLSIAQLNLGIQAIGQAGVTGDLTITAIEAITGASSIWVNPTETFDGLTTLVNGPVNGSDSYYKMSVGSDLSGGGDYGSIEVAGAVDLARVFFSTSGDASGTWNFFVINEEQDEAGNLVSFFTTGDFATVQLSGATANTFPAPAVSMPVGNVVVAVPEPSTVVLSCVGLVFAVAMRARRRAGRRAA